VRKTLLSYPRIKCINRIKSHNHFRQRIFEAMFHNDNAAFCEMRPQNIDHEFLTAQTFRINKIVKTYKQLAHLCSPS